MAQDATTIDAGDELRRGGTASPAHPDEQLPGLGVSDPATDRAGAATSTVSASTTAVTRPRALHYRFSVARIAS